MHTTATALMAACQAACRAGCKLCKRMGDLLQRCGQAGGHARHPGTCTVFAAQWERPRSLWGCCLFTDFTVGAVAKLQSSSSTSR